MKLRISIALILFLSINGLGAVTFDTLFIHSGETVFGSSEAQYRLSFNTNNAFTTQQPVLRQGITDTLYLTINNQDTSIHRVVFPSFTATTGNIDPSTSATVELIAGSRGVFDFYDDLHGGLNKYLGLSGIIEIGYTLPLFFWQLAEIDTNINPQTWNDMSHFEPQHFTINGLSAPQTITDSMGRVTGHVGDTLLIAIVNHGRMKHAMHFHGYHCSIIFDSSDPNRIGWSKETFPNDIGSQMVLQLVPDKPGMYPVHDHNLMAVLGEGEYVKGMMTMLHISP